MKYKILKKTEHFLFINKKGFLRIFQNENSMIELCICQLTEIDKEQFVWKYNPCGDYYINGLCKIKIHNNNVIFEDIKIKYDSIDTIKN